MEPQLFEVKPVDQDFYESRLRDFLPERIIDVHTHIWLASQVTKSQNVIGRTVSWPKRVAADNSIGDLLQSYRLLLPGKSVTPLVFTKPPGFPQPNVSGDLDVLNQYVARCAAEGGLPALAMVSPDWGAEKLEAKILAGGFIGVKVYLSLAPSYLPAEEIRIFDFLPPHQLDVLDQHGWLVMLHIPRPGRLGDSVNLAQMLEIERRWPQARIIIPHVGRAYCPEDVGQAFQRLAGTEHMMFDISANTNEDVFRGLIRAVGPKRILFGSDLPILRMRMRRVCEQGRYVNLVPRGLYGDLSEDPHMREVGDREAKRLTFFFYEEIDAFRRAAETEGLTPADVENVFHNNARNLFDQVAGASGPE
ncbi:MAG: amidohydrolase family protein [Anaerolineaceae bacterium]|nr:amidohydrolase family protein [Anaerolineaceae bacterium]